MPTKEDKMLFQGQLLTPFSCQRFTLRRKVNRARLPSFSRTSNRSRHRPRTENHSRSSSERAIIDSMMLIFREIPYVGQPNIEESRIAGSLDHTHIERSAKISREKRENVYFHPLGLLFPFRSSFRH